MFLYAKGEYPVACKPDGIHKNQSFLNSEAKNKLKTCDKPHPTKIVLFFINVL